MSEKVGGGGRGKGKPKGKSGRGSGQRMVIDNAEEMAIRDRIIEDKKDARARRRAEDDEEEGEEEEEAVPKTVFKMSEASADGLTGDGGMNRKEREAAEAQRKKDEYMRRTLAGETEEARKDLERLAIVRKRREEAAAQRAAQGRAPGWTQTGVESSSDDSDDSDEEDNKAPKPPKAVAPAPAPAPVLSEAQQKKKTAALEEAAPATGEVPILKSMDIKKMNGDALKDALKERGLDIQGAKKDLMKRLQDHEAARGGK